MTSTITRGYTRIYVRPQSHVTQWMADNLGRDDWFGTNCVDYYVLYFKHPEDAVTARLATGFETVDMETIWVDCGNRNAEMYVDNHE